MKLSTGALEPSHVDDAAGLLARRHRTACDALPVLDDALAEPLAARALLEPLLARTNTIAIAAVGDGALLGYLCATIDDDELRIPAAGNVVSSDARVGGALYAHVARIAVERGVLSHQVVVPLTSGESGSDLAVWHGLSFGHEQAYAVLGLPTAGEMASEDTQVRIATLDDLDRVLPLAGLVAELQNAPPVFAGIADDFFAQLRSSHAEEIMNPGSTYYVLDRGDRIDGLAIAAPAEPSLTVPPGALELVFQVTRTDARGTGVGTRLFRRLVHDATADGYKSVVTDWRTANQLSSVFWPRRGFQPVAYRLRRVIAEGARVRTPSS